MRVAATIEGKVSLQRSRFFAVLFPAGSQDDLEAVLRQRRAEYRKARHHCWAWRGRDASGRVVEQARDDGEVGHPGRVLLDLLRHHDLEGGIAVSRVFGGVKLGVGGVSRAFREAGEAVIQELLHRAGD